ncbi:MAG: DUF3332 family protein [Candidatus Sumerlaeia bacterium]
MYRSLRKGLIISMIAVWMFVSLGCYGRFPLTRAVYRTNGNVGGQIQGDSTQKKIFQSIVMWVFIIIPVYGVAMFVDAIVLNVMEFWTGNVVQIGSVERDGVQYAFVPSADGKEATLTLSRNGQVINTTRFTRVSDKEMQVRDAQGKLTGKLLRDATGAVQYQAAM